MCHSMKEKSQALHFAVSHELVHAGSVLTGHFGIRQLNLKGARQIWGNAIGKAPKDEIFKKYIETKLQLGNIDRCRKLYEKHLECCPTFFGYAGTAMEGMRSTLIIYSERKCRLQNLKILEAAYKWKKQESAVDED
ncbi:hypothetical protein Nepgr_010994 [Nepenthes gracilis]|uniref:Uncharacterized protein n=1 Tax=Nepenthes gracilis TaxID=150966 RepID=A0AAD3SEF9_NEPGR|nr:hypothetical protein Nepgr_010994 [Nepenthes gracilis]